MKDTFNANSFLRQTLREPVQSRRCEFGINIGRQCENEATCAWGHVPLCNEHGGDRAKGDTDRKMDEKL